MEIIEKNHSFFVEKQFMLILKKMPNFMGFFICLIQEFFSYKKIKIRNVKKIKKIIVFFMQYIYYFFVNKIRKVLLA